MEHIKGSAGIIDNTYPFINEMDQLFKLEIRSAGCPEELLRNMLNSFTLLLRL